MNKLFAVVCFLGFLACASGLLGVDLDVPTSLTSFQCLKKAGASFAVVRCYTGGAPDAACPKTVMSAWAANLTSVQLYLTPCTTSSCPSASAQVTGLSTFIEANNIKHDMLWLDISAPTTWPTTPSSNQIVFQQLVSTAVQLNFAVGVYTTQNDWFTIMGSTFTSGSSLPLTYAYLDGEENFDDFVPFAGWTQPHGKQYKANVNMCSTTVDFDYRPLVEPTTTATSTHAATGTPTATAAHAATHTGNSNTGHANSANSGSHTGSSSHSATSGGVQSSSTASLVSSSGAQSSGNLVASSGSISTGPPNLSSSGSDSQVSSGNVVASSDGGASSGGASSGFSSSGGYSSSGR
eukprot:TRINITY_DN11904_c0_g1_i1.p1 TRINITY_DN11904_c0_g1~~TRINITY_DN11904_c0_g1_i1.p1  ORF type:complete len:350 (-),score=81.66 TRINITY_DN11904_c0_g1_i1:213-1262(-)